MTKNRAHKQAARQRAAVTGERYVVAQRAVAGVEPQQAGRIHALTHMVPGVPAHVTGGLQGRKPRHANSPRWLRSNSRHNEPRVLVAWQNWIARHFGAASH